MTLSTRDRDLVDSMKQREFSVKKQQRAAHTIYRQGRRYRRLLLAVTALVFAAAVTATMVVMEIVFDRSSEWWLRALVVFVVGVAGLLVGSAWLGTPFGQRLLDDHAERLNEKHSGDLHAGRKWQQFYYRHEDISVYIPQILYLLENDERFGSVDDALAYVQAHTQESAGMGSRGLELFESIAEETNLVVISTADDRGRPSSRFMRFVTTARPGVWYVTTAPDAPKVQDFERGLVAVLTAPTDQGSTISSSRVHIRRADVNLFEIADLYRTQAPRYLDGMTEDDQASELVYELRFESAKVSSWLDQELVVFDAS
jgi:hypothetical protein